MSTLSLPVPQEPTSINLLPKFIPRPRDEEALKMTMPASSPGLRTSVKRKRRHSNSFKSRESSLPSHLPTNSINPFSRSPSERRQLALAGLQDTDEDPTKEIESFPHRGVSRGLTLVPQAGEGLDYGAAHTQLEEADGMNRDDRKRTTERRVRSIHHGSQLDTLLRSIHQLLDRGEIKKSARLFAVLLKLRPDSRPIDMRQHNIWAIGTEIIMREGEEALLGTHRPQDTEVDGPTFVANAVSGTSVYTHMRIPRRWGSAANINKLKSYLETLIQKHPYDHRFPRNTSALDFQLTLLSCEIYYCNAAYISAQTFLDTGLHGWTEQLPQEADQYSEGPFENKIHELDFAAGPSDSQVNQPAGTDGGRLDAYKTMKNIADRMDSLVNELPYSKNNHFLQLRSTASLFILDLITSATHGNSNDASEAKRVEQETARAMLQRINDNGGYPVTPFMDINGKHEDAGEEPSQHQLYASLPIRGT